ncbi:hypothetical protein [Enemella evansiae]|uniref:hypothetical protein n=1 Tax=Enemella evansiae TaxID=2016499 RepID=UPI000B979D51|nr:hypothetical protein [Enemella evansiae]OYO05447.1 hypothetical protein CGZ97_01575 [Enemella evansiae]
MDPPGRGLDHPARHGIELHAGNRMVVLNQAEAADAAAMLAGAVEYAEQRPYCAGCEQSGAHHG